MTLDDVRAAAIDRALVGDDPEPALALAGVADHAVRHVTDNGSEASDRGGRGGTTGRSPATTPLAATMLAVTCLAAGGYRPLDERAWQPGTAPDPLVVAGAVAAVRTRDVAIDQVAELAGCAPSRLDAAIERQRRDETGR